MYLYIDNSRTWSIFMRHVSVMYGLIDPLQCLQIDPPVKNNYKEHINIKVTAFHEKELRILAKNNSKMTYLNVDTLGLSGRCHPALFNLYAASEVEKCRPHIKMLCKDYYTYEIRSVQSGGSPHCRSCTIATTEKPYIENIEHILVHCTAYSDTRNRVLSEIQTLFIECQIPFPFQDITRDSATLCQFILDPTSLNLSKRINPTDPAAVQFFELSRDLCFSIHKKRMKIITSLKQN